MEKETKSYELLSLDEGEKVNDILKNSKVRATQRKERGKFYPSSVSSSDNGANLGSSNSISVTRIAHLSSKVSLIDSKSATTYHCSSR